MSSYWIDSKYLKLIPLQQFTPKGDGKWNFRCAVCGDSAKSKTLKRGWAITFNNTIIIKCFNCDMKPLHISHYLKLYHPDLYSDYIKEVFMETGSFNKRIKKEKPFNLFSQTYDSLNLQLISDFPDSHLAVKYLKNRKLSKELTSTFYYTDDYYKWVHENIDTKHFNFPHEGDKRIVIPFFDEYNKIFAVQGRTIEYKTPKYVTVKTIESDNKLFGLNKIDFSKKIYVVEGPIDSLFLDNCLAMAGTITNLNSILNKTNKDNIVIVPDNDKKNRETKKITENLLKTGYKVVIWPIQFPYKDINDAVINGLTRKTINDIIDKNTYSGLMGLTKFKLKR